VALSEDVREIQVIDEPEADATSAPVAGSGGDLGTQMRVRKRDGSLEPVDLNKIVRAVARCAAGLDNVDSMRVATRTISGLVDGATTEDLDNLSIRTAAAFIAEEPNYSRLAARLLATVIDKEVQNQDIYSFSQSVALGQVQGIIGDETAEMVATHARKLNDAILTERNWRYEFFGLRTVFDRYLLRHPETRKVIETPQYFLMRVACGLATSPDEAIEFYELISSLDYLPSSPTLFNSGTTHPQMSSCYLLDSPEDNLDAIYDRYRDVARLSKHAGGIGLSYSRIRSRDSLIRGTNGLSNGIVPWLKTLDSSVAAVNQGGRRKGAACVYLETWHADIEAFLELKENTGDHARRTHNLNLANWVPDLFMERVEQDWQWSLFDPKKVPHLVDLYGDEFREAYLRAESEGLYETQVPARQLYSRMMRSLAETGNGWMTFKDASNEKCNQTGSVAADGRPNVVHLSNLCTEILEVTNQAETAVCNLGSVNLGAMVRPDASGALAFDVDRLAEVVRLAVPFLDRVVDINYYPTDAAENSNSKWRPVGLGLMGLQDVFFKLRLPFDSDEARELSNRISEEIYFHALTASNELAAQHGPHGGWEESRAAKGELQFDLWGVTPSDPARWDALKEKIAQHGLRNSLLIAIAPTATIASIAGCYECIEPQVSNLFKRETLSGEFLQINAYLVPVDRADHRGDQAQRGLGAGHRGDPRRDPLHLPHRLGAPDAGADRHGRRPRRLHRPVAVAQPVHGVTHDREALLDVPARLEVGAEDHLLPALPPGDPDQQDHDRRHRERQRRRTQRRWRAGHSAARAVRRRRCGGRRRAVQRRRGGRLLAGEPRVLRGVSVSARS
jgi:ribonucleoside-diphosphate reductase alpha chain